MLRATSVLFFFLLLLAAFLAGCGPGEAQHYDCNHAAQQVIKGRMPSSSTFDEHSTLTSSMSQDEARITGDAERGWIINTVMVFGVKNASGVQTDYLAWYEGRVDKERNCSIIWVGDPIKYTR